MHPVTRTTLALAATGAAGIAYAAGIERNAFTLRRFTAPVLAPGTRPLSVLHLSDLHLMPGQRRKLAWVRGLAELEPDLVVNTGDNIAHPDSIDVLLGELRPLLEVPGVFVMGSNDYFRPRLKNPALYLTPRFASGTGITPRLPTGRLTRGFIDAGWLDLNNARRALTVAGVPLEFVGVDDPHLHYDDYDLVTGSPDRAAAVTSGVTHAPYQRTLDAMAADGARLLIAGHTHGGQLALPFYGAIVTNCDLDQRRAKGLSRWWPGAGTAGPGGTAARDSAAPADAAWLEVSAGLGTSPYAPVRFACRPEATLLTLTARPAEPTAG